MMFSVRKPLISVVLFRWNTVW